MDWTILLGAVAGAFIVQLLLLCIGLRNTTIVWVTLSVGVYLYYHEPSKISGPILDKSQEATDGK